MKTTNGCNTKVVQDSKSCSGDNDNTHNGIDKTKFELHREFTVTKVVVAF